MLRYGVLGLLIERRGYGYELVQRLGARLGQAWQLNPSAVYAALDQLEDAGLIEAMPQDKAEAPESAANAAASPRARRLARRAERVFYRATEAGVAEFDAWLARPSTRVEPIRSELALKLALARPDAVAPLLGAIAHEERLIVQVLHDLCNVAADDRERRRPGRGALRVVGHARTGVMANGAAGQTGGMADGPAAQAGGVANGAAGRAGGGSDRLAEQTRPASPAGAWTSATSALVGAAAATRLQGELDWLQSVRETLQRMLPENVAAAAPAGLADTVSLG
ncbi:MAG TPA: PadR family transcriptional regulator [Methylomirabilota bacterium]|nr:PadR family transcriptional regulator [Methylomirabilota bacterium]